MDCVLAYGNVDFCLVSKSHLFVISQLKLCKNGAPTSPLNRSDTEASSRISLVVALVPIAGVETVVFLSSLQLVAPRI